MKVTYLTFYNISKLFNFFLFINKFHLIAAKSDAWKLDFKSVSQPAFLHFAGGKVRLSNFSFYQGVSIYDLGKDIPSQLQQESDT